MAEATGALPPWTPSKVDAIAAQLRQLALVFGGNVAGAAQYANGVESQTWLPLPAAYVIPLDEEAEPNESWPGLQQIIHEKIGVIVVLSTPNAGGSPDPADRRGQAAAQSLGAIRSAVFRAILNWRPNWDSNLPLLNHEARGLYYIGGRFPTESAFDRARFFYEFIFGLDTTITDADGWQQPYDNLIDVTGTVTTIGNTVFDVPLQG